MTTRHRNNSPWTPEQEEQLRSMLAAGNHINKIAKQLNRTPTVVRAKAYKMKLLLGYSRSTRPR
jgi:DNA-binding NarL/FixJ family response regulator